MVSRGPVLDDVPPQSAFWTCSGVILHNLQDLILFLKSCKDNEFVYHVNTDHDKNDFANWVRDVIHDEVLARNLSNTLTKKAYADKVKERYDDLQSWDFAIRAKARA